MMSAYCRTFTLKHFGYLNLCYCIHEEQRLGQTCEGLSEHSLFTHKMIMTKLKAVSHIHRIRTETEPKPLRQPNCIVSFSADLSHMNRIRGPDKLEVVASFCYLGDMFSAGGGCEMAVTTHVKTAWKKFRELLPVLTSRHLSYKTRGHVYSSCMRSTMLHASETWPLTKTNLQRLQRNDRAMIRQICSIKPEDVVRSSELLAKLQLEDLDLILRERRLNWFGHVERSSGAIRTAYYMQIDSKREAGRPKQTWKN